MPKQQKIEYVWPKYTSILYCKHKINILHEVVPFLRSCHNYLWGFINSRALKSMDLTN